MLPEVFVSLSLSTKFPSLDEEIHISFVASFKSYANLTVPPGATDTSAGSSLFASDTVVVKFMVLAFGLVEVLSTKVQLPSVAISYPLVTDLPLSL